MTSTPFLKEIAAIILQPGAYDLSSICVIFPNKRARLYMSRYIGEITDRPVWAPRYFTISELMETTSGYQFADRLTLLFELYKAYSKVTGSSESFDSFFPFSETLLSDFDEIDKYLVNAGDLFQNLSGLKLLDGRFNYLTDEQVQYIKRFWSTFSEDKLSDGQSLFLSLWKSLSDIYIEFRNRLSDKGLAYEGMAYRQVAENPGRIEQEFSKTSKFLIVGFNALSRAEEALFTRLKNTGKAEFFWDYDIKYLDPVHEAGAFIRNNTNRYPQEKELDHDHLENKKENILFVPVYSNSGQAAALPGIFKRLNIADKPDVERTALVLADERLLMTVLYAIPEYINDVNVTMGYPLSSSAVFSLIDSLYQLKKNSSKQADGSIRWYFGDIMSVMNNPLLKGRYIQKIDLIRQTALKRHMVYLSSSEITDDPANDIIFNSQLQADTVKYLLDIITSVIRGLPGTGNTKSTADPVQVELIFQVYTFLTRLHDVLNEQGLSPGPETVFRLIRRMLRNTSIPFSGEPLAGLQTLGVLETRTLDFENVIVLSANEGVLPKPPDRPSFIPYNLRAGFGLPTPEHHDAIYAYYFYRLIQRARNIVFVYDASSGGLQTGERSRFLHQLHYDMQLDIKELNWSSSVSQIPVKPVIIPKTGDVEVVLSGYLGENARVLSPSAINTYLNCPLQFYFSHIIRLPQPEEVTGEVDARLFGNLVHKSLMIIYGRFGKEVVTESRIREILTDEEFINDAVDRAFSSELFGDPDGKGNRKPEGYNLIIRQVVYTYVKQFLKTEANSVLFTIQSLEEKHFSDIPVTVNGIKANVKIGGIIDRIDLSDGKIRILDYKTGGAKEKPKSVEQLFNGEEKLRNDAVFQVLLYSYVYRLLHPGVKIQPGLFYMRQTHKESFSPSIEIGREEVDDYSKVADEFEARLTEALEGLFNVNVPFRQTSNLKVCGYCVYKDICRR